MAEAVDRSNFGICLDLWNHSGVVRDLYAPLVLDLSGGGPRAPSLSNYRRGVHGSPTAHPHGIFEALLTRQDTMRFIQVRHQEAAAFAACGYAKYTGRLGGR